MNVFFLLVALAAAEARPAFTSPKPPEPEHGFGMSADEARAGWITLFGGDQPLGWTGGGSKSIDGATTTSEFGDYDLKISTQSGGELVVGKERKTIAVPRGVSTHRVQGVGRGPIRFHFS